MNAIVVNTLSGAVSEYTGFDFHAITPTHAGAATGLFALGGDADLDQPIVAEVRMPCTLRESTLKKAVDMVYLSIRGGGCANLTVHGARQAWRYSFPLQASGQTRCKPGKGIRENYLGFGLSNPAGQAFTLDRVEVLLVGSNTRRVGHGS